MRINLALIRRNNLPYLIMQIIMANLLRGDFGDELFKFNISVKIVT
jgi:hypothetical protein